MFGGSRRRQPPARVSCALPPANALPTHASIARMPLARGSPYLFNSHDSLKPTLDMSPELVAWNLSHRTRRRSRSSSRLPSSAGDDMLIKLSTAPNLGNGESQCRDRSSSGVHESPRLQLVLVFGRCRCRSQGAADDPDECRRGTVKKSQQEEFIRSFPHR